MRGAMVSLMIITAAAGTAAADPKVSGLRPGEEVSAWEPIHVAGPHAGTATCPVCTYLEAPVLLVFAKDVQAATPLARPLEQIAERHSKGKLKVILVVVNGSSDALRQLAADTAIRNLMFCRPDPQRRAAQLQSYRIDGSATNTFMLYQNYRVSRAWTDLAPSAFSEVRKATDVYLPRD